MQFNAVAAYLYREAATQQIVLEKTQNETAGNCFYVCIVLVVWTEHKLGNNCSERLRPFIVERLQRRRTSISLV